MVLSSSADAYQCSARRIATGPQLTYAERGVAGSEPVLLLHGWLDSWRSFERVIDCMPPTWHVFAIDQRGFGDAERPPAGYTIDQYADDAVAFLDAVGIDRATVVGHSMGSLIARRVAELHPERVKRLVLIGTGYAVRNEVTQELGEVVRTLGDPIPASFVREFQGSTIFHPVPAPFFEQVISETMKAPARVWKDALDGIMAFDDTADLGRITAPTLILWGDRDALFTSRAEQERLAAAIPNATLIVLAETGHSPNWERPAQVAAALEAFVSAGR